MKKMQPQILRGHRPDHTAAVREDGLQWDRGLPPLLTLGFGIGVEPQL